MVTYFASPLSSLRNLKYTKILLYVILLITFATGSLLVSNQKFRELFKLETYIIADETNSTSNRVQIYNCALALIKERPLLGYGIEYDRDALHNCYKESLYYLYENKFNTHNQYLSVWMKIGLIGLVGFLGFLGYNLNLSHKAKDWLYFPILVYFIIIMFTENILQNGVMLFTFLINYFTFFNLIRINQ